MNFQQTKPTEFDYAGYQTQQAQSALSQHKTKETGAMLPMVQALITGGFLAMAAGGISYLAGSDLAFLDRVARSGSWILGTFVIVSPLTWMSLLMDWVNAKNVFEKLFKVDIDHDGYKGQRPKESLEIDYREKADGGGQHRTFTTFKDKDKMISFARGILGGRPWTLKEWTGKDREFSRKEFDTIRETFVNRGWAEWRDDEYHDQGADFTDAGKVVLRRIANHPPTPSARME
jgi:hypothetical protein